MNSLVLTTGGTGGHIFPALAVAEEVKARNPQARVLFVGGRYGPEGRLARAAGLEFAGLPVRGVLGRGMRAVAACAGLAAGLCRAAVLLRKARPQVVAGFGGYAGLCPVLAGALTGVPSAVHEQNSVPGAANKLLGKFVQKVFLTYPDERGTFPKDKTVLTGNPVRGAIRALADEEPRRPDPGEPRLLVLGGSQGARALNQAAAASWPELRRLGVRVRHQAGPRHLEETRAAYAAHGGEQPESVSAFIEDMAEAYRWADLVVCRAGATTLAELAVAGKPSVLVPFPQATHDHQTANAAFLQRAGAATLAPQDDLEARGIAAYALPLLADTARLVEMGSAARGQSHPDAAARVVDELEKLAAKAA
ncbi:undecaprenyldiphospho-muramoylpentapeptide beta-N-acetylglucosaminyltransferase [Desulfohalovibrio reitneri]|uniref:undecaprenyldiphospho-muramoylpentapeptide beta-N-acetylglucosaminyltransferase n=1 Tax=Desulfohalovibrio reitneri TaxID=1307759 RepID=UPI0004A763B6|nr:undecaprenyldiphospho-muramoylpentapeptide beta-N-acetylglucosaminyltransferase [Desulfohalovibrio reitneri]